MASVGRSFLGLGRAGYRLVESWGQLIRITVMGTLNLLIPPFRFRLIVRQLEFIGVQSLPIIFLASVFTGGVFTLQSLAAFGMFGAEGMVGGTVGVALTTQLGPTLTGLLVTGRAGSAMAAELGSMRVSEQIDALDAMAVDPMNYLIKPRLWGSVLAMPMLTAVFDGVGIAGSYLVAVPWKGLSEPEFLVRLHDWVDWDDIYQGLLKGLVFGFIMGAVACWKGFYTTGGAKGVGRATTSSVVISSVSILVANFFISWVLL